MKVKDLIKILKKCKEDDIVFAQCNVSKHGWREEIHLKNHWIFDDECALFKSQDKEETVIASEEYAVKKYRGKKNFVELDFKENKR